jgi:hypothetical protein
VPDPCGRGAGRPQPGPRRGLVSCSCRRARLAHRRESKKIAKSTAAGHDLADLNPEPAGAGGVPQPDAVLAAVPRW